MYNICLLIHIHIRMYMYNLMPYMLFCFCEGVSYYNLSNVLPRGKLFYIIDWYSFLKNVHWCFDALYWKLRWKCRQQLGSKVTTLDRTMRAKKKMTKSGTWCLPSITTPLIITPYLLWQCSKKYLVKLISIICTLISTADGITLTVVHVKHVFGFGLRFK